MLLEAHPDILDVEDKSGAAYQQLRAAEISLYEDQKPFEFVVKHTPGNIVFPSVALNCLFSDNKNWQRFADKMFELGLDADEMLVTSCGIPSGPFTHLSEQIFAIRKCVEHGADFSYNNYEGLLNIAARGDEKLLTALCQEGLDINMDNGALLKEAVAACNINALATLFKCGADANLLNDRVATHIKDPGNLTSVDMSFLSDIQIFVDNQRQGFEQRGEAVPGTSMQP